MKESFWGDVYGQTTMVWKQLLESDSQRQRDRYAVRAVYQRRRSRRQPYRNDHLQRIALPLLGLTSSFQSRWR
jgi:hypothetical protein